MACTAGTPFDGLAAQVLGQPLKEEGMLAVIESGAGVRRARVVLAAATAALAAGAFALIGAAPASAKTVWLCLPGHKPDPCTPGLSTTIYSPKLKKLGVTHPKQVS